MVFWGHGVTSGIVDSSSSSHTLDLLLPREAQSIRNMFVDPLPVALDFLRGGPDYFVSSVLFERGRAGGLAYAQARYSERLILMQVRCKYWLRIEKNQFDNDTPNLRN